MELRKKSEGPKNVTLEWTPPVGVQWYVFFAAGDRISNSPPVNKDGVAKTEIQVSKSKMPVRVVAIVRNGDSFSLDIGTYTLADPTPVPVPTTNKITVATDGTLTWNKVSNIKMWQIATISPTGADSYLHIGDTTTYKPVPHPGEKWGYDVIAVGSDGKFVGDWIGRVQYQWTGTAPAPDPVPTPDPTPVPTGDQTIGICLGGWGADAMRDLKNTGIGYIRMGGNGYGNLALARSLGMVIQSIIFGEGGRIQDIDPASYAANVKKMALEHKPLWVEILNEPEGTWFWSDANTQGAADHLALLLKAVRSALAGTGVKIAASAQDHDGWREKFIKAGCHKFCDAVVCHPYGGSNKSAQSAAGNRSMVEETARLCGIPCLLSEIGWPTATGRNSTGDSAQWTEAEQADNIDKFMSWVRTRKDIIAGVCYFMYNDYGDNMWYGIAHENGSHKPSWAVFAKHADN